MQHKSAILFLCPHGGAKSVIAASYFNRLAAEHALPFAGNAAAAENPYAAVPEPVARLLQDEGFDVHAFVPRRVEEEDVRIATKVVSIDCDVASLGVPDSLVERWTDVPLASEDLHGCAAAIRGHVTTLAEELRERR